MGELDAAGMGGNGRKLGGNGGNGRKLDGNGGNGQEWAGMGRDGQEWGERAGMGRNGQEWYRMGGNGMKMPFVVTILYNIKPMAWGICSGMDLNSISPPIFSLFI